MWGASEWVRRANSSPMRAAARLFPRDSARGKQLDEGQFVGACGIRVGTSASPPAGGGHQQLPDAA
eukprot:3313380-Lingulodinium_polyedra.AAC.1